MYVCMYVYIYMYIYISIYEFAALAVLKFSAKGDNTLLWHLVPSLMSRRARINTWHSGHRMKQEICYLALDWQTDGIEGSSLQDMVSNVSIPSPISTLSTHSWGSNYDCSDQELL